MEGPKADADPAQRILEAADALFAQQGYDGVSVRDVARAAGVNKASVFYYFSTKEKLFERVMTRYYDAHRRALEDAFAVEGTIDSRLHHLIDGYLDFIIANDRYPRLVQGLLLSSPGEVPLVSRGIGTLFEWTKTSLTAIAPATGPKSTRQIFVTIAGAVLNYMVYAPALASAWGDDPLAPESFEERRAHMHWLVDLMLADLDASTPTG